MARERSIYVGPRLRRLRRELGLNQSDVARDLGVSASYVALLERNQRPVTAGLLLRLAQTYKVDVSALAPEDTADYAARLKTVFQDPLFADIDLSPFEAADVSANYAGVTEAILRLYTAFREEQMALADSGADDQSERARKSQERDPVAEARGFLSARRNSFPVLDDAAERLAEAVDGSSGVTEHLRARHGLKVRRLPAEIMSGFTRRLDQHRDELLLSNRLDAASLNFQLALQLAYLELNGEIEGLLKPAGLKTASGERLTRRALASYAAAAFLMPYSAFAKAAESRRYDVEALARQFGTSFEQTAHRLTTLQKPGQERVPFFFIRVDPAGNVSKRLDGAGFPFARHGGGCPLWTVHQVFRTPGEVVTQWLELPEGERYFSVARTVSAGGGGYGAPRVERAIALVCAAEHAHKLIYAQGRIGSAASAEPTPIGIACRLCHRAKCPARSVPPIGRQVVADDFLRLDAPFGLADA